MCEKGLILRLYDVTPMLVREVCDHMSLDDLAYLAKTCRLLRQFVAKTYDIGIIHLLYRESQWDAIREKDPGLNHKRIREWNPLFGMAYVYAYYWRQTKRKKGA